MAGENLMVLKTLMNDEMLIGELYRKYSSKFPVYQQFWARLAQEEASHADSLRFLCTKGESGEIVFSVGNVNLMAMTAFTGYISRSIKEADSEIVTVKGAAAIAMDIEKSLIDHKAFDLFVTEDQMFKTIMKKITTETEEHMRVCKDLFRQLES